MTEKEVEVIEPTEKYEGPTVASLAKEAGMDPTTFVQQMLSSLVAFTKGQSEDGLTNLHIRVDAEEGSWNVICHRIVE